MEPFFEQYLERLGALHEAIRREIVGLPPEALDWSPGAGMNSMAVLVTHLTGAERYWIGDVALQEPSGRDREAEFRFLGAAADQLAGRLEASLAYARQGLAELELGDLGRQRISPRAEKPSAYTIAWALLHALEHTAIHLGHIQLTRQLYQDRLETGRNTVHDL